MRKIPPAIGLCAVCNHAKVVKSAKGSAFIMCGLAKVNRRFRKYPLLPVIQCSGYEERSPPDEETNL